MNPVEIETVLRAAGEGDLDTLTRQLGADPTLANAAGTNPYWGGRVQPLHLAVTWCQEAAVAILLDQGADPSGENDGYGGWSPLLIAAAKGYEAIGRRLEVAGAYVGLFEAAALGRAAAVREILAGNPERAHHVLRDGTTPLHVAATVEIADEFLAAGVTPGGLDEYGSTPLDSALSRAACGSVEAEVLARRLIEAGASADAPTYAALGDMEALEHAIDADPIIRDATGRGGRAPLHAAVAHGRLKAALWLLGRGAHPSRPDANGISPLHWASRAPRHDVEIATCLLAAGADPRARDGEHDGTPASWAEFQRRPELERVLRKAEVGPAETR